MKSCDTTSMFEQLLESVEQKEKNKHMPVRMFYRNTFDNLINDAIFALKNFGWSDKQEIEQKVSGNISYVLPQQFETPEEWEENQ